MDGWIGCPPPPLPPPLSALSYKTSRETTDAKAKLFALGAKKKKELDQLAMLFLKRRPCKKKVAAAAGTGPHSAREPYKNNPKPFLPHCRSLERG